MSQGVNDQHRSELEPTITPVRRAAPDASESAASGSPLVRRIFLTATVLAMLVGAVYVFGVLPERISEQAELPEPVVEVDVDPDPVPELSDEQRAALTDAAESLLAQLLEQRQLLDRRAVGSWGDTTWSAYEAVSTAADEALLDDDPQTAVQLYQEALASGEALLERSNGIVREALAAGTQALETGDSALAAAQFAIVLEIEPNNAAARRGSERASTLQQVLAAANRGDQASAAGDLEAAAAAWREAIAIDPDFTTARTALNAVNQRIEDRRFDRLLGEGFALSESGQHERAAEVLQQALSMRPNSPDALDALARAEQGMQQDAILMAEVRARAFESRELWDQAIARYREALATDPTLAFAIQGLTRAQERADLDAKLEALNTEPTRLLDAEVMTEARSILATAQAIPEAGPRLQDQRVLLARLIELADTPIQVALISDGETEVTVYRVGDLGTFTRMEIGLKPGNYTATGQRRGYRDVRQTFSVLPGNVTEPVTIICSERI